MCDAFLLFFVVFHKSISIYVNIACEWLQKYTVPVAGCNINLGESQESGQDPNYPKLEGQRPALLQKLTGCCGRGDQDNSECSVEEN